jgi:hypothetical protein
MAWFEKAKTELYEAVNRVMQSTHPELHAAAVHVDVIVARSEDGPPLTVRGVECAGTIRITSSRERALGIGDAVMVLNGELLPTWSDKRLASAIDRELMRLELTKDKKTGEPKEDDQGRPKLRIRPFDFSIEGFHDVADRNGRESIEYGLASELLDAAVWMQPLLPGFDLNTVPIKTDVADLKPKTKRARVAG